MASALPWNLALAALIGLSLLFMRTTLGADSDLANGCHVIGSFALAVVSIAAGEVARPVRYLNIALGAILMTIPFVFTASIVATVVIVALGSALIVVSIPRGRIRKSYGNWNRLIV